MMKLIRWVLGKLILFFDSAFKPAEPVLDDAARARLDHATSGLSLYQFEACPFCVKVRREMRRMGIRIPLKDAKNDPALAEELKREGGQLQVPCLKIESPGQKTRWIYESDDIIAHLKQLVA